MWRLPWHAPVWNAGTGGIGLVPGFVRKHIEFWDGVVLHGHPLRDELVPYFRDGFSVYDFLIDSCRGTSKTVPYNAEQFPGAVFANRVPPEHADFVDADMQSVISRG